MMYRRNGELARYFVYILSNKSMTLYTGITGNLHDRLNAHARPFRKGFTSRYHFDRVVYYEEYANALDAIAREKQIKGWTRRRKIDLVKTKNPEWRDLTVDFAERKKR